MAEGVKAWGRIQPACMPGSWKDSMKDGSHCQGQLWQCQFDVLSSRAPHSLLLTAPSWYSCVSWWFSDANSHMAKWFSPLPLHPPPSAAGAWVPPTACLSQRAWKLAGEEVLACANYILIIGNVLANQALIAILEPSALLCRLGMRLGGWGVCGARMSLSPDTPSWTPRSPPQLDMAACLAYCWVGAVPHYSWGIEEDQYGEMGICAMLILKSPTHTSHIPLSFSPTYYTVCQSRHCELRNNK